MVLKFECADCKALFDFLKDVQAHCVAAKHRMAWPCVARDNVNEVASERESREVSTDATGQRHCASCNMYFQTVKNFDVHKFWTHVKVEQEKEVNARLERYRREEDYKQMQEKAMAGNRKKQSRQEKRKRGEAARRAEQAKSRGQKQGSERRKGGVKLQEPIEMASKHDRKRQPKLGRRKVRDIEERAAASGRVETAEEVKRQEVTGTSPPLAKNKDELDQELEELLAMMELGVDHPANSHVPTRSIQIRQIVPGREVSVPAVEAASITSLQEPTLKEFPNEAARAKYCSGCNIHFDTWELYQSHVDEYGGLRLAHAPIYGGPVRKEWKKKQWKGEAATRGQAGKTVKAPEGEVLNARDLKFNDSPFFPAILPSGFSKQMKELNRIRGVKIKEKTWKFSAKKPVRKQLTMKLKNGTRVKCLTAEQREARRQRKWEAKRDRKREGRLA